MADRRLRSRIRQIDRALHRYGVRYGQEFSWYEFDSTTVADTADLDLYDEGGPQLGGGKSRRWFDPVLVMALQANLEEGAEQVQETGQYQVARLQLVVSHEELRRRGIAQPADRGAHLNDRIGYDNRLFSVNDYEPRGRVADALVTVEISCLEVMADEQETDLVDWTVPRP